MKKPILLIIAICCVFIALFFGVKSNEYSERAHSAISQQAYDIKEYGWEAAKDSYYNTYETYSNKSKACKTIIGISAIVAVGTLTLYFVPIKKKQVK